MPDSKELVVPEAAVEAAVVAVNEYPPESWLGDEDMLRCGLTAAYPEIHRAVVAEVRERLLDEIQYHRNEEEGHQENSQRGDSYHFRCRAEGRAAQAGHTVERLEDLTAALTEQADNQGEAG